MPDWLAFFTDAIEAIHKPFTTILSAAGCREGWLQGELFRAGQPYDLRVNEFSLGSRQTADLSCGDMPEMIGEIKIVGAEYFPKMQGFVESDVERMRLFSVASTQRFMLLIIPTSEADTKLGRWLHSCNFSERFVERNWPGFKLRIWQF